MKPSVKVVLFAGIIGLQVASVAAIVVSSYVTAQESLLDLANRAMSAAAEDGVEHLEEFFRPAHDAAVLTERLAKHEVLQADDAIVMERYFYETLKLTPWLDGIFYGGKDGSFVFVRTDDATADGGFFTKVIDVDGEVRTVDVTLRSADFEEFARGPDVDDTFDPRTRPWFENAIASEGITWTQPYVFFTSGHPGISTAIAVRDRDGRVVGVVGVDIVIAELSEFVAALKTGEHGAAFIFDRNGDIIAFPDTETVARKSDRLEDGLRFAKVNDLRAPAAKAAIHSLGDDLSGLEIAGEVFGRFEVDDRTYVSIAVPYPSEAWEWVLGLYFPEDVILGDIRENRLFNMILAAAIGGIACIVGILIWRSVARFFDALRQGAVAVESGRLDTDWTFRSGFSELADTGAVFARMIDGLRSRDRDNSRLTQSLRTEIAAHERTELELRESEERHALALAGTNDGIWDWDIKSDRIEISARLAEILGFGTESLRKSSSDVYRIVHPDDRAAYRSALVAHLKARQGFFVCECRLLREDGSCIWALTRGLALWNSDGEAYRMAGSVTDVTERKAAEEQLRQSQKMEALGSLAGGIAHEFNNQLLPIVALTELVADDLPEGTEGRRNLEQVIAAAGRSRDLIEQILTYSRKRARRAEPMILRQQVASALDLLRSALPSNIAIRADLGDEPGRVLADRTDIQSVVLNLATNASHAIGIGKGLIRVALRRRMLADAAECAAHGLAAGGYLELSVDDDGQGMDKETMDRIFDPFFTTKPEGAGTGMGLSIVSGIVTGAGGTITVESRTGLGTTFKVLLPLLEDS